MTDASPVNQERRECFESLVREHHAALLGYARNVYREVDAEDLVSKTWEIAWRRLDDMQADVEQTWLIGILRNVAANDLRTTRRERARRESYEQRLSRPYVDSDPDIDLVDSVDALERAYFQLSSEDREVLLLTVGFGFSIAEVAKALQISVSAAKSRSARASNRLAGLYENGQSDG